MNAKISNHGPIQPEIFERLSARAQRLGKSVNDLLKDMLDEGELPERAREELSSISVEEWSQALKAWAKSHRPRSTPADDSRGSIYEGRGE